MFSTNPGSNTQKSAVVQPHTSHPRNQRPAGHCWRSKDELRSDILLWTPTHGHTSVGQPAMTFIHWLCVDTGCSQENIPEAIDDRSGY